MSAVREVGILLDRDSPLHAVAADRRTRCGLPIPAGAQPCTMTQAQVYRIQTCALCWSATPPRAALSGPR